MKELLLFRLFALFPFIGIVMPDLANWFGGYSSAVTKEHIIVDITLALCLCICSLCIWLAENHQPRAAQLS